MKKVKAVELSIVAKAVLQAIVEGATDSATIATKTNAKVTSVAGSIAGLKKNKYVTTNAAGELKATAKGRTLISGPKAPREGSKMAQAFAVIQKMQGKTRAEKLAALQSKVGLSEAGAATYLSTLSKRLPEETPEVAPAAVAA